MTTQTYNDIVTPELLEGTLDHDVHPGFKEDYRILSCLLKIYKPATICEIGTNVGGGINVMAAALPTAKIYSLDLDYATMMHNSKQYPIGPNGEDRVGSAAKVPYTQLRGDSLTFDYSKYPCEAAYVDGEHTKKHAQHEISELIKVGTKLIIAHDCDMSEVWEGFQNAIKETSVSYELFRVSDTRIGYAVRK